MAFFCRSLRRPHRTSKLYHQTYRTFVDDATLKKLVRDRGLDHAVEKEKNLKPMVNIKNLIKSEPSKSIPITIIADKKETLNIPIRPIEFIRNYPSIFEEFLPGGINIHPHIRLTPEVLNLDAEEQLIYQSDHYRQEAADRLLKLLMLTRVNKIPLKVVDRLKWDLGLPPDYVKTVVPEFPDYFQIIGSKDSVFGSDDKSLLELVCWSNELATSNMEKKVELDYKKGMPIAFPVQYSRGFEMDKKFKKWVDEWQKLPYISPYENASHLQSKSDESDRWVVAILHELLHLLVSKKTDRENILCFGEYLGLRSRFKRALLYHPGIFYLSSKIGTRTVVLREGYKRDSLIQKHQMMTMRYQYIHLMHTVKEVPKLMGDSDQKQQKQQQIQPEQKQQQTSQDSEGGQEEEDDESGEEQVGELSDLSNSEVEDITDDDDCDDDEEDEHVSGRGGRKNVGRNGGRTARKRNLELHGPRKNLLQERSIGRYPVKSKDRVQSSVSKRTEMHSRDNGCERGLERSDIGRNSGRSSSASRTLEVSKTTELHSRDNARRREPDRSDFKRNSGRSLPESRTSEVSKRIEMDIRSNARGRGSKRSDIRSSGRSSSDNRTSYVSKKAEMGSRDNARGRGWEKSDFSSSGRSSPVSRTSEVSKRTEMDGRDNARGSGLERSDFRRSRARSSPASRPT